MVEYIPLYGAFPESSEDISPPYPSDNVFGLGAPPGSRMRGIRASVGVHGVGVGAGEGVLSDTTQTGQALADYLQRVGIATACNSWTANGEFANLVRQFQQAFGGSVDGQYGPDTAGALATVVGTASAPPGCARFGGSAGGVVHPAPAPAPAPAPRPAPAPLPAPAPAPTPHITPVVVVDKQTAKDNTMWWVLGGAVLLGGGAYLYTQQKKGTVSGMPARLSRRFRRR